MVGSGERVASMLLPKRAMQCGHDIRRPSRPWAGRGGCAGLTLVEVMVAAAMIGIVASTTFFAMIQMNQNAAVSRLYTGAMTAGQNEIDLLLTDAPFNPQKNQIPPEWNTAQPTTSTVTIYQDPAAGVVVSGTQSTSVVALNPTYNGNLLYEYRATVTITYSYRNRNYSVAMSTLRASDI